MFGKLRTIHLVLAVALLAAIWWWSGRTSPIAKARTFQDVIWSLDTAAVDSFLIEQASFKRFPPIRFYRAEGSWNMVMGMDTAPADPASVNDVLGTIKDLRVQRLVGPLTQVQEIYDLDDLNVERLHVAVNGEQRTLLVGQATGGDEPHTVISPAGDTMAYAVAGLLGMRTDQLFSGWIPKILIQGDPRNWKQVTFLFPGNRGYVMQNRDGKWYIADRQLDQERTVRYLVSLGRSRGSELTDPGDTLGAVPAYQVIVEDTTREVPMTVVVSQVNDHYIARSSLAPMHIIPFDPEKEIPRMFRPPQAFLPDTTAGAR